MLLLSQLFDIMSQISQREESFMRAVGDKQRETIRPEFHRSISIDFLGAKITSDRGFLLV